LQATVTSATYKATNSTIVPGEVVETLVPGSQLSSVVTLSRMMSVRVVVFCLAHAWL
jgi:hypothetical protein